MISFFAKVALLCGKNKNKIVNKKSHNYFCQFLVFTMGLNKATIWKEVKCLLHPYYWINIILSVSFVFLRLMNPFCQFLFGPGTEACELDMRENEILFFLLIIIMVKSRKSGATHSAVSYLASGFIYAKVPKK